MNIYYELSNPQIEFGVKELKKTIENLKKDVVSKGLLDFFGHVETESIVVFLSGHFKQYQSESLKPEGFNITTRANITYIEGADYSGAMYGLFELSEQIRLDGFSSFPNITMEPFHGMRGVKFNLPYEPFGGYGDPYEHNINTCMDLEFWLKYIDFLALSRYNCLSLWSEHPFHMMFRIAKYPDTCPYTDIELKRFKDVYKFIFSHCKKRGIKTYIITWNICLIPQVAKGLGLNEEIGYMTPEHHADNFKQYFEIPSQKRCMFDVRQASPLVKDYLKECIKTLAITYPDLDGVGTNCAEEMNGDSYSRHQWVSEAYLGGIEESGRQNFDFFIRTNQGAGKVAKETFVDQYKNGDTYISWKYSNAHMYSSTSPTFEEQWGAWEGLDLDELKIVYTLRNDDYYTFRSGNPDFLKEYLINMKKPYVHGFYWGADGYIWAKNFQHVPHTHSPEDYDFQKHWFQFELIGRLAYCPEVSDKIWIRKFEDLYGVTFGKKFYQATCESGKILPLVNRLCWENYDFQWHPESLITINGFKSVLDIMNTISMPGEKSLSIREYAKKVVKGSSTDLENVESVTAELNRIGGSIQDSVQSFSAMSQSESQSGLWVCTMLDLKAWQELALYYKYKLKSAFNLCLFDETANEEYRRHAVDDLEKAFVHWENLSAIWASHYLPYKMVRTDFYFGFSYYTEYVKKDIELAKKFDRDMPYHLNVYTVASKGWEESDSLSRDINIKNV